MRKRANPHTLADMPEVNGSLLRRKRRWLDMKTANVAAAVGISEGSLRNIEGGRAEASDAVVNKLAESLELAVEDIVANGPRKPGRAA